MIRRSPGLVGVALAGGKSSRMGRDKALLRLDGASLLERTVARLGQVTAEVLVADRGLGLARQGSSPDGPPPACWSIADGPGAGPVAGILGAAVERPGHDLLVLACDLPEVPEALLSRLAEPIEDEDVYLPRWSRGLEPLCARYRPAALDLMMIEAQAGRLALHAMLKLPQLKVRYLEGHPLDAFGSPERLFVNLNSPQDLARFDGSIDANRA